MLPPLKLIGPRRGYRLPPRPRLVRAVGICSFPSRNWSYAWFFVAAGVPEAAGGVVGGPDRSDCGGAVRPRSGVQGAYHRGGDQQWHLRLRGGRQRHPSGVHGGRVRGVYTCIPVNLAS
eukprot:4081603-Pyramimonas_sp.AAC.1